MQLPKLSITGKQKKTALIILGLLLCLFVAAGALAYSKREALLHRMVEKAINKAHKDYGLDIQIKTYGFSGLSRVKLNGLVVLPEDRDTLCNIQELSVGVKLLPLVFGDVKLAELKLNEGSINVVMRDSLSNLDFFLKRKKTDTTQQAEPIKLAKLAEKLVNELLYKIPDEMEVNNFRMSLNDNDTASVKLFITKASIEGGKLQSTILLDDTLATWHINGTLQPGSKQLDVRLFADNKSVELPYLNNKLKAKISFDTVSTQMKDAGFSGGDYKISGSWAIKNLQLNHPKLSADDILVPDAQIDADMLVGDNFVCLDSSSTVRLHHAIVHPYIKYTLNPSKIYELKLNVPEQDAQSLFNALPIGLFDSLEGIKVAGKLNYQLNFYLDSSQPDSVKFSSSLQPKQFKILQFGKTDFQKINNSFVYTPYEYGKPMRNITIGPSNPNFTRLEEISPNFRNALLTAEDPSFFHHKGFVEESIRKSIAVNFKEKKFKRGGSTISMQLVKNVFLSRKKTIARKIEEILIVWLIENNRLVSKSRMLEVYFNIIEMGNNVYGIGEAARYYFGKLPADLNLGEGIFLANIVPRPKIALYKFQSDGSLKPYLHNYFNFIGNIMARRGLAPADTTGYGFYNVQLREGLRHYLLPDSVEVDTNAVAIGEDDMMSPEGMNDASKRMFDRLFAPNKTDSLKKANDSTKQRTNERLEGINERRKQPNK